MIRRTSVATVAAVAYVGTVVGANAAIDHFGVIPVGLGYVAPAGVYFVSLALVLRDYVQWALGKPVMLTALTVGAIVSYCVADSNIATASAAAFAFSELADFLVFTRLAPRWGLAVFAGGIFGAVVDSMIFLQVAFGSLAFMPGQVLGKAYGIVIAAALIWARRRRIESAL